RAAPCQDPERQAARRRQERCRLHRWRGGRDGPDEGGTLPRRGRADAPRRNLLQGQELGRSHGQGRPIDYRPEPGFVWPDCQTSDRGSEQESEIARPWISSATSHRGLAAGPPIEEENSSALSPIISAQISLS